MVNLTEKVEKMVKIGKFYIFPLDTSYESLHAGFEVDQLIILMFTG